MADGIFVTDNIVHVGAALYLAGFLFRDQIMLRGLIIAGDLVYIAYFFLAPAEPLWGGIFWSAVFAAVNTAMIARIVADRTEFGLSDEERALFAHLRHLSPGEFRKLMKAGRFETAAADTALTQEGAGLHRLYFVLTGTIAIDKAGKHFTVPAPAFIGEVAFLTGAPASATATLAAGGRYAAWETPALHRLLLTAPSLRIGLHAALNQDMAGKVARG
jgi:hypothetical protein